MQRRLLFFLLGGLIALGSCQNVSTNSTKKEQTILESKHYPADHFFLQRSYPDFSFDLDAYTNAMYSAKDQLRLRTGFLGFDKSWVSRGPGNIGARINTVAVHPTDPDIMLSGFSGGGVFKTTDGGFNWYPVFDDQVFLSIGDIAFDPSNPETIYVGTGDPNISGYPFIGDGVYKSEDGGETWENIGLTDQRIVSHIRVHPQDPKTIFVGCMGLPFERNEDRGLYRTKNGGETWEKILFVSDQAGVIDIVLHPENPEIIYASSWDRIRNNSESTITGPNARIYRSNDGGDTWEQLTEGLPAEEIGRIGLAISESNTDVLYAVYVSTSSNVENIFKTEDGGDTWAPVIDWDSNPGLSPFALGGFGWYFGKIRVNPRDENDIFLLGVDLWRSKNGGANWATSASFFVHADKHDLFFIDSTTVLLATDGGLYKSVDEGTNWFDIENIPATQFYRVAYNPHRPDWYYGGTQDNGSIGGPDLDVEWERIFGGDGFQMIFHPEEPDYFFAETQNGGLVVTFDGGQNWDNATNGITRSDRRNWDMPVIMSEHDPNVMYTGTYRVYKNPDGVLVNWDTISNDLTDGLIFSSNFHTISTLYESPVVPGLLYVGTTDGNVWRTQDDGMNWELITEGLPDRYVTDVKASPDSPNTVFVSHSGYKDNEFTPRIFKSDDRGDTWENISSNLPDLAINDIYVLPYHADSVLFVGTDGGVYGSLNGGTNWERLGSNMPYAAVYDLDLNEARNELMAGTYARSLLSFSLDSLNLAPDTIVNVANEYLSISEVQVFPNPATTSITVEMDDLGQANNVELEILSSNGQLMQRQMLEGIGKQRLELNVQEFAPGVYYINIKTGLGEILSKPFLKQ